ncbi:hypothetical protein ACQRBN_06940 [Bariatricus sp. SGI.154]|uniref:hypothetical protein n=1 Tax=Bariatricus sp. SGI.154 TaxID=3420549 RepID=UPI003D048B92
MKKVILLEDNLKVAEEFIDQLIEWKEKEKRDIKIDKMLFYEDTLNAEEVKELEGVRSICNKGIDVEWVNVISFDYVMDNLYSDPDNLFIFDTYLLSDESFVFKYRVNVGYALQKINDKRIWFYTNAGADIKDSIDRIFGDMVIETELEEGRHMLRFMDNKEFVQKVG